MSQSLRRPVAVVAAAASLALAAGLIGGTPARAASTGLIINEFYGRGGSANQPFTHKFVELHNPTGATISLSGTSVQYRAATSTANATAVTALSGEVTPGGYFVLQLNSNGTTGAALPNVDQTAGWAPSGTTGTIFLANTTTAISPANTGSIIDKLGYGGSNSPEITAATYTGSNSTPGSLGRTTFVDTDNNAADFAVTAEVTPGAPNPGQGGGAGPTPTASPTP
ncbi:MAG: lamin tail domain-containing protein, partial [Propionibacteriaceae bacterium]|nr:lamin tail domain-containing protein [Propionibacteriaceae bacterium]